MRILFFSYAYPNAAQPGLGTFNRTMIAALAAEHAVRVVAPVGYLERWKQVARNWWSPRSAPAAAEAYQAVVGVTATHPTWYYPPKLWRHRYHEYQWRSVSRTLMGAIKEFRPDVVLSYWAHPDGAVAVQAARAAGLPSAVIVGGSDVLLLARSGPRRQAILKALNEADAVIPVSGHIGRTLEEDGLLPEKIHVVPRGVDHGVFAPGSRAAARSQLGLDPQAIHLVSVGRLVPVKCFPDVLAAADLLRARGLKVQTHLLGSGPLQSTLEGEIRRRGLSDCVHLRGPQPQRDLVHWYRAADVTVLASHSEGVPNVLMETLASGGRFVATNVGGIPDLADPAHDRLVPVHDPAALTAAITDVVQSGPVTTPRRFAPRSHLLAAAQLVDVLQGVVASRASTTAGMLEVTG